MDSVALLGPNIAYQVKRTFISIPGDPPATARARASSSPPAFRRSAASTPDPATRACRGARGMSVRLGNLPNRAKPGRVRAFCADLGLLQHVDSIYMPLDPKTGVGKGFAFVHFADEASAVAFMSKADGQRLPRCHSEKLMNTTSARRQAIAHIPKHMPKNRIADRTYTAYLWLR